MSCKVHETLGDVLGTAGGFTTRQPAVVVSLTVSQTVGNQKCILISQMIGLSDCPEDNATYNITLTDEILAGGFEFDYADNALPDTVGPVTLDEPLTWDELTLEDLDTLTVVEYTIMGVA